MASTLKINSSCRYKILSSPEHTQSAVKNVLRREFSNAELSTVLRPFYFAVHPDLFGQHPVQRSTNEESLKYLSAFLESFQSQRSPHMAPATLKFYIRDKGARGENCSATFAIAF